MRSRAERVRVVAELVLRGVALAALAALLWRALRPPPVEGTRLATGDELAGALARWTIEPPARAHVVLDRAPDARTRDWLRALGHAGTSVAWSSSRALGAAAVVAEPTAEPYGATRVRLAAASGSAVSLGDAAGLIDTLPHGGSSELELGSVAGSVRASGATF